MVKKCCKGQKLIPGLGWRFITQQLNKTNFLTFKMPVCFQHVLSSKQCPVDMIPCRQIQMVNSSPIWVSSGRVKDALRGLLQWVMSSSTELVLDRRFFGCRRRGVGALPLLTCCRLCGGVAVKIPNPHSADFLCIRFIQRWNGQRFVQCFGVCSSTCCDVR